MKSERKPEGPGPWRAFAPVAVLSLAVAACEAPGLENVLITMPEHQAVADGEFPSTTAARLRILPVREARSDFVGSLIGRKTTVGALPMGHIELAPPPVALMTQVLHTELAAAGYRITDSGADFTVEAQLDAFNVLTPATAFYWDLNGTIAMTLTVTGSEGTHRQSRYHAECTERTYIFPGRELLTTVVATCVDKIAAEIRGDAALAGFLATR